MSKVYLVPTSGEALPCPGGELQAIGQEVELDQFWRRRLRDGDVAKGKPPKATTPETSETKVK